jgi:hypothetical protein
MPITTNLSGLNIGGVGVPAVGSYSWTENRDAIDCTEIGNSDAKYIHGLRNCSLSFDVFYLESDHAALETFIATQQTSPQAFVLTHTTSDTIEGSGLITSLNITASAGDVIRASFTLQATGAVSRS